MMFNTLIILTATAGALAAPLDARSEPCTKSSSATWQSSSSMGPEATASSAKLMATTSTADWSTAVATTSLGGNYTPTGSSTVSALPTKDLTTELLLAPNQIARIQILSNAGGNESFVFDYNNPPAAAVVPGPAGKVTAATGSSFPALIGLNSGMALFEVNACGLVAPHLHPRSDEYIFVTKGQIFTQFLTETGSELISNKITHKQGTIFPKGSVHLEFNPTCDKAEFVGAFNSEDPGTAFIAPNFFSFDEELILNSLGGSTFISGSDIESIKHGIPHGAVVNVLECLNRCGLPVNQKRSLRTVMGIEN
ncbi:RmlC-like cupin domain-containing protein [Lipomyces doorenjongii]